jgi:putative phosphoserine phosphatase/1-acylglycerol-3-phosphate O-acyltransferase
MAPEKAMHGLANRIRAAPDGPEIAAVFDYDGTVISGFSAEAFYRKRFTDFDIGPEEAVKLLIAAAKGVSSERDFAEFLALSLEPWKGKREEEIAELGEKLFTQQIAARLHTEVWQLVAEHKAKGHTVVLASSATRFQADPMARDLGADHVLCTGAQTKDGVLTGRPEGVPLWGEGKAAAVRALAKKHGLALERSFAYSNGAEDVPLLASVGHPVAVAPDDTLRRMAGERDWPVLSCTPRGGRPGLGDVLRTAGFYGSFAAAAATGLGVGLLNRSRKQAFELTGGIGADVGLALAGVDLDIVEGAEYLWSARPCVFVFNHQSKLDIPIVMELLRGGFTGVAKKESAKIPGFGQLFWLANVAFVDRGNTEQAKKALEPAVARLRAGTSLALSPEGTRSATPKLGRFKKGAFHIAMQAGVPIVPIVLRNVGEVMWRGAQVVRPGTVDVKVLAPVDTTGWKSEDAGRHAEDLHDRFEATLENWWRPPRTDELAQRRSGS